MTKNGQMILDIIRQSAEHMTAEQIFQQIKKKKPGIVMATVYNNLNFLVETGQVRRVRMYGEADRFDKCMDPHEHMVCDKCGKVIDIQVADIEKRLEERLRVKVTGVDLNVHFICQECQG